MKKLWILVILVILADIADRHITSVHAQTAGIPASFTVSGSHTACTPIVTGVTTFCLAADGVWQSINGAAYVQLAPVGAASGVTSFNGRTGAVVSAPGDYAYSQLSSPPTTFTGVLK
jgi:hypothetical protein